MNDDADPDADRLIHALSSRRILLQQLGRHMLGGKGAARRAAEALAGRHSDAPQTVPELLPAIPHAHPPAVGAGLYGYFHAETGIGQSARRSALSFRANNYPIACHAISASDLCEDRVPFDTTADLEPSFETVLLHLNADSLLAISPRLPDALFKRRRVIGFWHWELPVFPAPCMGAIGMVHEIWTPSRFTADAIATATGKPIHVVPHAVPTGSIDPAIARGALGLPVEDFIVLATFDSNSYLARKNPVGTIQAFRDAFSTGGFAAARLVIKIHGRGRRTHLFEEMQRQAAADPRITIIDQVYTSEAMTLLQNACDVALSLHRSEGFGLNIAEAMAAGKLAIATDFSGNVDFMDGHNSLLIPYAMRAVAPGDYCYGGGQWWAEPDHDAAVDALRLAFARSAQTTTLAANAMRDMAQNHSYERIGGLAIAALNGSSGAPSQQFTSSP